MSENDDFQRHHLPKNCQFCSKAAAYSPLHELSATINKKIAIYFCSDCRAEYLYWRDSNKLYSWSLYTKISEKLYRWSVMPDSVATLWLVKKPGVPGIAINKGLEVVKTFDPGEGNAIPDITPENINAKIKTWLVFL